MSTSQRIGSGADARRHALTLLAACLALTAAHPGVPQTADPIRPARWAVLPFANRSGQGGGEVGRSATDTVALELDQLDRYDLFSRQEVQQAQDALGLPDVVSVDAQRRLARRLGADAVVTGDVAVIALQARPPQARVLLTVRVRDARTGELVNGARTVGLSEPRTAPVLDGEELVAEAISDAAFAAVAQMSQYTPPRATVLILQDANTVVLNRGSRTGCALASPWSSPDSGSG